MCGVGHRPGAYLVGSRDGPLAAAQGHRPDRPDATNGGAVGGCCCCCGGGCCRCCCFQTCCFIVGDAYGSSACVIAVVLHLCPWRTGESLQELQPRSRPSDHYVAGHLCRVRVVREHADPHNTVGVRLGRGRDACGCSSDGYSCGYSCGGGANAIACPKGAKWAWRDHQP